MSSFWYFLDDKNWVHFKIRSLESFKQQLENLMPKYNRRTGRRPISRMKRDFSQQRPKMLQPAPMVKSVDGQVKLRLMPNITVTHPIGNV